MTRCCFRSLPVFAAILAIFVLLQSCKAQNRDHAEPQNATTPVQAGDDKLQSAETDCPPEYKILTVEAEDGVTHEAIPIFLVKGSCTVVSKYCWRFHEIGLSGKTTAMVPESCLVSMRFIARGYLEEEIEFPVLFADKRPVARILLKHGMRVKGKVVSAEDGTPIPNVAIGFPDWERYIRYPYFANFRRGILSGPDGSFDIQGVSPGYNALYFAHKDFMHQCVKIGESGNPEEGAIEGIRVEMTRGRDIDWEEPVFDFSPVPEHTRFPTISPKMKMPITISDGASPSGTGTIRGTVFKKSAGDWNERNGLDPGGKPEEPWRWARMSWQQGKNDGHSHGFHTDENGYYELTGVPAGWNLVSIVYLDGDIELEQRVYVQADGISEVNFYGKLPKSHIRIRLEVASKKYSGKEWFLNAQLEALPPTRGPVRDFEWLQSDDQGILKLCGLGPGKYRLTLTNLINKKVVFDGTTTASENPDEILVELVPGRILGTFFEGAENCSWPVVTAVPRDGAKPLRQNNAPGTMHYFIINCLCPGFYDVVCHDWNGGYCRIRDVFVESSSETDIGEHTLSRGIDLVGKIDDLGKTPPDAFVVTGEGGLELRADKEAIGENGKFVLRNLWPGVWKVKALAGESTIAEGEVTIPEGASEASITMHKSGEVDK